MPLNKQLAATLMATFRDVELRHHALLLRTFSVGQWKSSLHWLDASGLALYFLQRLKSLGIEQAIPDSILCQLEQRRADNALRTAGMLDECLRLNSHFQQAGIAYANLKGFTLAPDYCPDLSLRYQIDCDFLVAAQDAVLCGEILKSLGYGLVAANKNVMEFNSGNGRMPRLENLYKAQPHSVELHVCNEAFPHLHPDLLRRSRVMLLNGFACPALSTEDMFLSQVRHLFRHLCSEWTRISWLLEFRHFVENNADDRFWRALGEKVSNDNRIDVCLGVVAKVAHLAFGCRAVNQLTSRSIMRLPAAVALWVEQYGREVLLSQFPGSKLYMLLQQALGDENASTLRLRLFPVRLPGRVVAASTKNSRERTIAAITQLRYFLFRLRFHARANARYFIASWRWKRLCKRSPAITSQAATPICGVGASD